VTGGEDRGTGLGLSLVYAIVTDFAGAIDVKSAPNQGSTFAIYLPLADAIASPPIQGDSPIAQRKGNRVLLVDDGVGLDG
jgi:Histidine kinase-, DNA gyrase B-, and HSP90-like ATPase